MLSVTLTLQREPSVDGCTPGTLAVNGLFECFTLEDQIRDGPKVIHETAIPAGTYEVVITRSQRFQRMLPLLLNVPGFEGVRIHAGNISADTSGCVLVGQSRGHDSILSSALALGHLQPQIATALAKGERVWMEILNPKATEELRA